MTQSTAPAPQPVGQLGSIRLLALVVVALLVRLAVSWESGQSDYHRQLVLDAATYHRIAVEGDPRGPFWQPPLYPWFLRAIYSLVGEPNAPAVRVVQAGLGTITCVLLASLVARRAGRGAGLAAGWGLALYGPAVYFDQELLAASPAAFLTTLLLWVFDRPDQATPRQRVLRVVGTGVVLGAMALLLPSFFVAAALLLLSWWRREGWRGPVLTGVIASLFVIPVSIRNYAAEPDLVAVSYNGGVNLYLGNNPNYPETVAIRPGIEWGHLVEKPRCEGGATTAAGESRWFRQQVLRHALSAPLQFLQHVGWKLTATCSIREIGRNREIYDAREESQVMRLLLHPIGWPMVLLLPLAAMSITALARTRTLPNAWLVVLVGVLAVGVIFFPTARYRLPAIPLLIGLSALGIRQIQRRDWLIGGVALGVGLIPHGIPPIARSETLYEIAVDRDLAGDSATALTLLDRALVLDPDSADIQLHRGLALAKLGREEQARQQLEAVAALRPDAEIAAQGLALYWMRQRNWNEARAWFERAVAANPCNQRVRATFAMALTDEGYFHEARRQLDQAKRVYPRPDSRVIEAERRLDRVSPRR